MNNYSRTQLADDIIKSVKKHSNPEDVFDSSTLRGWAEKNGFISEKDHQDIIDGLNDQIADLKEKIEELNEEISKLEDQTSDLRAQVNELKSEI